MAGQEYFQAALANFMFDAASGGAIRHLADLGYTAAQIRKRLDFPSPYERIQQAVWEHFLQKGILRFEEPGTLGLREQYEYVAEYDQYGKKSFRRVAVNSEKEGAVAWKVRRLSGNEADRLASCLRELCRENGEGAAYVSCDFGLRSRRDPAGYAKALQCLEESDREYVEGLPWERRKVYHRLDGRMRNIVIRLYERGEFSGSCYFMDIGEKLEVNMPS